MNNNKTELIAINRLKDAILQSDILEPYIDDNDKTPSWDGNIFVYKSPSTTKRNLKGKIPIQIKGTYVNKFSNEKITFPFEIADLNNYLTDGGVLFFVVEITNISNVRIYYRSLLPLDIKNLLLEAKDAQKTISSTLKYIDTSNTKSLESICFDFLFHKELQYSTVNHSKTIENFDIINCTVFTGGIAPNKYMLENEIYIYGKESKDSIPLPIDKIHIEAISHQVLRTISINSEVYFDNYNVTESKENMFITIGNNILFHPSTGKLNFKLIGTLAERLKEIQFLEELVRNQYFFIGDVKIEGLNVSEEAKEQIHQNLKYLNDIKSVLKLFNIKEDLNINSINERGYSNLCMLIDIVLYNKKVKSKSGNTGIQHIKIGNIDILALIIIVEDRTISIYNYFTPLYKMFRYTIRFGEDKKEYEGSLYFTLKAKDIVQASNLDLSVVEEDVKRIVLNTVYADYITLLILELIKAYDINKKIINSLNTALALCEWLEKDDDISVIYKINRLQIVKRLRGLEKQEKEELIKVRMNEVNNFPVLCAISILLDNKSDFEYCFEKLSDKDREAFIEYPIYNIKSDI